MNIPKADCASARSDMPADNSTSSLLRSLGTVRLVMFVIAAVAPLAAVIGVLPVALVFGSGATLPLAFVAATVIVGLFSVGYSAISREVVAGGAFYTYIARGLGSVTGLGAATVAVISYTVFVPGGLSYLGFVMQTASKDILGVNVDWLWFSLGSWALIGILGYRQLEVSSRLVMVLILFEFGLLMVFDGGVFSHLGTASLPMQALNFGALLHGAPGVSVLLAFTCYFGIESAALYSEETKAPEKSVARATYVAVALIGIFYFLTSWITVGAVGPDNIQAIPAEDVGLIYFKLSDKYLSGVFTHVIQAALATSMFATVLSIHNVAARYIFVLGRQRCLPVALGRVHPVHRSPYMASVTVSVVSFAIVVSAAALKIHPMLGLGTVALGFAAVGVMFMQTLTSLAVVAFFWRRPARKTWNHVCAPLLSFFGLLAALAISLNNFEFLSGSSNPIVNKLPSGIGLAMISGIAYALWLRRKHPDRLLSLLDDK